MSIRINNVIQANEYEQIESDCLYNVFNASEMAIEIVKIGLRISENSVNYEVLVSNYTNSILLSRLLESKTENR